MNKIVKRALWGFGILVSFLVIVSAMYIVGFFMETRKMTPAETGRVNDSLLVVRDKFVNAYLFKGKTGYLLFDAGYGEDSFRKELEKTGISVDAVKAIFLTHCDGDHIGSIGLYPHPQIFMHRDEEQMINGTTAKMGPFKTHWKFGPYQLLNDKDTLTVDGVFVQVLHTPGHTPGSVCYVVNKDYLVTGDNLKPEKGKAVHFVDRFNMNTQQEEASLKLLPELSTFRYLLTGHYGVVKNR
ncbi:MAG: MBL fold metallo-hydrolase [Marinilabiliales bacterium]|nr:MBL fold metallo-hydrolase [Marinilabiliales bacterium]